MIGKRPAFQFYSGDWLRDPAVRSVSLAARGLWFDMLCLMFESDPKGYLALDQRPVSVEQLARMVGAPGKEVGGLLDELESSRVFSRTEDGVIYSRRMVRDESRRERCIQNGKKGGNPALTRSDNPGVNPEVDREPKRRNNLKPTPSSSSSTSTSVNRNTPPTPPSGAKAPTATEVMETWNLQAQISGWTPCHHLGEQRLGSYRARCRDDFWKSHWRAALAKASGLAWLKGENRRQWVADIDWFLRPRTVARLLEGHYDDRGPPSYAGGRGPGAEVGSGSRVRASPGKYDGVEEKTLWVGEAAAPRAAAH